MVERDVSLVDQPDVSALTPEAQPVALAAAAIYARHTRPWLIGLLAHGSALKGGYIPGCSDVDLQLYLRAEAFDDDSRLPLAVGLAIQRDLARIPLGPFNYIQCYALPPHPRLGWVGPIPGAYHMILGRLPRPEATASDLRDAARRALDGTRPTPAYIADGMLTYSLARLERHAGVLCTDVWPCVYHILTLAESDPIAMWRLAKPDAIARLPESADVRAKAGRFLQTVQSAFAGRRSAARYVAVIDEGVNLRSAVAGWYRARIADGIDYTETSA
ncbi:MAG TPA: hypothetical protein VF808_15445 [Ktedonobacterales bacterium]